MTLDFDPRKETDKFLWLLKGRDVFELSGENCIHTWFLNPEKNQKQSCFYYPSELEKAVKDAQQASGKYHVYVGLGYRDKKLSPNEKR